MEIDILLSHGYFLQEDPHEQTIMKPYPPLGLLYLSSYLKDRGYRVEVFDSTFENRQSFADFLLRRRPAVVGLYCNLITRQSVLRLVRLCRQAGCRTILGGPEPANYAEEYLDHGADVVVVGEGEQTLEELLTYWNRGDERLENIPGLVFRNSQGTTIRTAPREQLRDLDALPFPDREAIDLSRYLAVWRRHHGRGAVSLVTSRGCPYTCTWCSHSVFGYTYRSRSPGGVADEVEWILSRYQPDMLWYADDVFTLNRRWFEAYACELERRRIRIPFETISREDRLDEEVIRRLAEMGCFRLWIGSESGSQRILDAMQRRTDAGRVTKMVRLLQKHGIQAGLFVMLGYEGEDLSDLEATLEQLKRAGPDQFLTTVAYPIKGTPYYEEVSDRIVSRKPWHLSSDRDLDLSGRRSRRFYSCCRRWMEGEFQLHRHGTSPEHRSLAGTARALLNARLGRWGMYLTGRREPVQSRSR